MSPPPVRRLGAAVLTAALVVLLASSPMVAGAQGPPSAPVGTAGAPGGAPGTTTTLPSTPPTGANPASNTWSVAPAGPEPGQPGNRPNFTYEVAPGAAVRDAAVVWNYSDEQRTFSLYAKDAFTTPGGGVDLLTADQASTDVGAWVHFDTGSVTVPARSGVSVPLTLSVPADAVPGDHSGGIVASLVTATPEQRTDAGGQRVAVDHRVGLRLYLRVTGPLDPTIVVDDLAVRYDGPALPFGRGGVDVTYTVRNTGNVRMRAHQEVRVTGPLGWALAERPADDLPELLPGASITRTEHVDGVLPAVRVTGGLVLRPFPPSSSAAGIGDLEDVSRSASTTVVPWLLLLLVAAALGGFWAWRRAPRGRSSGGSGDGRARSVDEGGPAGDPAQDGDPSQDGDPAPAGGGGGAVVSGRP